MGAYPGGWMVLAIAVLRVKRRMVFGGMLDGERLRLAYSHRLLHFGELGLIHDGGGFRCLKLSRRREGTGCAVKEVLEAPE